MYYCTMYCQKAFVWICVHSLSLSLIANGVVGKSPSLLFLSLFFWGGISAICCTAGSSAAVVFLRSLIFICSPILWRFLPFVGALSPQYRGRGLHHWLLQSFFLSVWIYCFLMFDTFCFAEDRSEANYPPWDLLLWNALSYFYLTKNSPDFSTMTSLCPRVCV